MRKMTQADRDAGLTQEDVDLGLRGEVIKGGSDAAMRSRMASEKYDSPSIVDKYRDYSKNPEAKSFSIADRKKIKETTSEAEKPQRKTSNDAIGDLIKKLGSGRVGTTPSSFSDDLYAGGRKGGAVKMAKGGKVSSASKRADGCAVRGKTKGRMI
jgi:hypothetical protein